MLAYLKQAPHYYTLVTSLPSMRLSPSDHKQLPISARQINKRLDYLREEDRELVDQFVSYVMYASFRPNKAFLADAEAFYHDLPSQALKEIFAHFMRWRIITTVMRRELRGMKPVLDSFVRTPYFVDQSMDSDTITHKDFASYVRSHSPKVGVLRDLIMATEARKAEKELMNIQWDYLRRQAFDTDFGLDAVVIYVLQWTFLKKWLDTEPEASLAMINTEIDNVMASTQIDL